MKSNIKSWGIGVLMLAIIILALTGCLCATKVKENTPLSINSNSDVVADTELVPDVILKSDASGTFETKWNNAINTSITGNKEVVVRLEQDWRAALIAGTTSFGTGVGFKNGALCVPTNANIKLDLYGRVINRCLGTPVASGHVIGVEGKLTLLDSKYDSEKLYDTYNNSISKEIDFKLVTNGRITGGYTTEQGGGIKVNNGTFIMESGMICDNFAQGQGGGIYVSNSEITINDGLICENTSSVGNNNGGGIMISSDSTINMNGGIVYKNVSLGFSADGAGFAFNGGNIKGNLSNVLISKNINTGENVTDASIGAGISVSALRDTSILLNISNTIIEYNSSAYAGGGLAVWLGTVNVLNSYIRHNTALYGAGISAHMNATAIVTIRDTIVTDNTAQRGSGAYFVSGSVMTICSGTKIFNNYDVNSQEDDLRIDNSKVMIKEKLADTKVGISKINIANGVYTSGYGAYNGTTDPNNYFFSNISGEIVHLNSAGELEQVKTIASNEYDFIYLEGDSRKSYKDNNLVHGKNDFEKRQAYNGGKLILGKILPNTSVNEFVSKINYTGAEISLLNAQGDIVFGKNADESFADKLNNPSEYAVGTGWKLEVYTTAGDLIDDITLSVLGDLTGDGKVNSLDVTYMKKMINDKSLYEGLSDKACIKLAAFLVNNGKLTNADGEILWNIVCGKMSIQDFI